MADFNDENLSGSTFSDVDLSGSRFRMVDLSDSVFRAVTFRGMRMIGVELEDVQISGELQHVVINGVDVVPLIDAELNRRNPGRAKMRPEDPEGFREAWTIVEERWAATLARTAELDPALLHESVDGEWSFIETLRHLVFATDSWVGRCILGDPSPWHPLDLPWDEMADTAGVPRDREVRPSLADVVALRADRMATVRRVLAELTPERLAADTEPVEGPGWPPPQAYPVRECLLIVLNEEWEHRNYAERDLARMR